MTEIQTGVYQNPEILIEIEVNLDQANKYNSGIVGKQVTLGINAKVLRSKSIQTGVYQNPEILIEIEVNLDQANKYNSGIVGKQVTLGINAKVLRRRMEMILLML